MVRLKTAPVRSLEVKLELNDNFKCTLDPASVTNIAAVSKEEDLLARRAVPNFPTGSAPKYDRQFLHFSSPFIPSQAGQLPGSQPQPSSFSPGYSFTSPGSNYSHSHSSSALSPLPELNGGGSYELSSKRESTFASPSSSEITPKSSSSSSSSASLTRARPSTSTDRKKEKTTSFVHPLSHLPSMPLPDEVDKAIFECIIKSGRRCSQDRIALFIKDRWSYLRNTTTIEDYREAVRSALAGDAIKPHFFKKDSAARNAWALCESEDEATLHLRQPPQEPEEVTEKPVEEPVEEEEAGDSPTFISPGCEYPMTQLQRLISKCIASKGGICHFDDICHFVNENRNAGKGKDDKKADSRRAILTSLSKIKTHPFFKRIGSSKSSSYWRLTSANSYITEELEKNANRVQMEIEVKLEAERVQALLDEQRELQEKMTLASQQPQQQGAEQEQLQHQQEADNHVKEETPKLEPHPAQTSTLMDDIEEDDYDSYSEEDSKKKLRGSSKKEIKPKKTPKKDKDAEEPSVMSAAGLSSRLRKALESNLSADEIVQQDEEYSRLTELQILIIKTLGKLGGTAEIDEITQVIEKSWGKLRRKNGTKYTTDCRRAVQASLANNPNSNPMFRRESTTIDEASRKKNSTWSLAKKAVDYLHLYGLSVIPRTPETLALLSGSSPSPSCSSSSSSSSSSSNTPSLGSSSHNRSSNSSRSPSAPSSPSGHVHEANGNASNGSGPLKRGTAGEDQEAEAEGEEEGEDDEKPYESMVDNGLPLSPKSTPAYEDQMIVTIASIINRHGGSSKFQPILEAVAQVMELSYRTKDQRKMVEELLKPTLRPQNPSQAYFVEDSRVSGNWRLSPLGRSVLAKYNSEHDEINAAARSSNGSHTPTKRDVPMQDDEDNHSSDTDEDVESGSNSNDDGMGGKWLRKRKSETNSHHNTRGSPSKKLKRR